MGILCKNTIFFIIQPILMTSATNQRNNLI